MIYKRYRYRIYPTKVQAEQLARHFGAVRFIYNWGLATKKKAWDESKERVSRFDLQGQLPGKKKELTWLALPAAQSLVATISHLDEAFQGFYSGRGGYPRFKSKNSRQTLEYYQNAPIIQKKGVIKLPKIGAVKIVIDRPIVGEQKTVTVSKTSTGKYYASCVLAIDEGLPEKPEAVEADAVGVDLGIKSFAVLSTGEVIDNPRFLNKSLKALRRIQRNHSKKKKSGKNRYKSRKKLARLHEKVANQRKDFLHKVTTRLVRENQTVCIEDLNVGGMGKNRKLARHIQDAGWSEFRRQLTYKADWYGVNLKVIDRFAPSSRMCTCGTKNTELTLKQRSWTCAACGTTHDRDLLAAQNIVRFAFQSEPV